MLLVKFIVLLLLGFVIVSLFTGLYFLVKDKGQTNRTVNALTLRIALSVIAIIVVLIAGLTGVLEMNPDPITGQTPTPEAIEDQTESRDEEHKPGSGRRPITTND